MKFTKEEISLCKQVAEKHRKDIEYGDWVYTYKKEITLVISPIGKLDWSIRNYKVLPEQEGRGFYCVHENKNEYIPLWTISDCLEFLKEKGGFIVNAHDDTGDSFSIEIETAPGHWKGTRWLKTRKKFIGKGLLEACLKAVLAVLEEEGK